MPTVSYSFKTTWPVNPAQCLGHPFPPVVSMTLNSDFPSVHQVCWHERQNQNTRYMGISFVIGLTGAHQAEGTKDFGPSIANRSRRVAVCSWLSKVRVKEGRSECKGNKFK